MRARALLVALILSGVMLAQDTSGPQSPQWRSLSVEDKLRYDARHQVELDNFVYAGIGAAFYQARNRHVFIMGTPSFLRDRTRF